MNIGTTRGEIRDYIRSALVDSSIPKYRTIEAESHMLLNDSGGLYRPLLLIATAKGYSVAVKKALPFAAAVEFVHAASLIEDDIMDKSDTRRDKPSCHIQFGIDIALLAHTHLVQRAYEQILNPLNRVTNGQRIAIARKAYAVGKGMTLGQERDVTQESLESKEEIVRMYEKKSGLLIGLALASGGILGGACEEDVQALERMGIKAGVGYQIIDDALDERAPQSVTGKPRGQDANKKTLLKLVGWEEVKKLKAESDSEVDRLYGTLHGDQSLLMDLMLHLRHKHDQYLG